MLRLFLTVSVLFWNQLAAQDEVINKVYQFCHQVGCPLPCETTKYKNYALEKYSNIQWVQTVIGSMDRDDLKTGLDKLFNYSRFGNDADTIVPVSATWGILGKFDNGNLSPAFKTYLLLGREVNNPPKPTDQEVNIVSLGDSSFFVRDFDQIFKVEQYPALVTEFAKDLERDKQDFEKKYFSINFYNTRGLMKIGFGKFK